MNTSRISTTFIAAMALLATIGFNSQAQMVLVGDIELLPNTPDQLVTLSVTGVPATASLSFWVQIGSGNPSLLGTSAPSFASSIPTIQPVDIVTGTLFSLNHETPQYGTVSEDHRVFRGVDTIMGTTVSGSGLLASLRIDTTGLTTGTWPLSLTGVFDGNQFNANTTFLYSNFDPIPVTIQNGTLTIVPEPRQTATVVCFGLVALALARRRFPFAPAA